jgi:hypothetical protein
MKGSSGIESGVAMISERMGEALERIEARLECIDGRLGTLERRVESIVVPPQAYKKEDAARLLSCDVKTLNKEIRRGLIRTVPVGSREHVPLSEIIRKTSVLTQPQRAPSVPSKRDRAALKRSKIADSIRLLGKRR